MAILKAPHALASVFFASAFLVSDGCFPEDGRITPGQAEVAMMAPETVTCQHLWVPHRKVPSKPGGLRYQEGKEPSRFLA